MMTLSWQRSEVLPWHSAPDPSHCTQAEPSPAQKAPSQVSAQQTLAPETVTAQLPEAQSLPVVQLSPSTSRQVPLTSVRSEGQTQLPPVPHTRPEVPQSASQQRFVPVTSRLQIADSHCAPVSHTAPVARSAPHRPVPGSQPFPQSSVMRELSAQRRDVVGLEHSTVAPSHWTQRAPSSLQVRPWPEQASMQQRLAPVDVASQAPDEHWSEVSHAEVDVSRQPLASHAHSAPARRSSNVQSAALRHVPYPRQRLTVRSSV